MLERRMSEAGEQEMMRGKKKKKKKPGLLAVI